MTGFARGFGSDVLDVIHLRGMGRCEIAAAGCNLYVDDVHHRRPRGMGGTRRLDTNTAANGLSACRTCHRHVESHRAWAYVNGFLLHQHQDPLQVPVWWRCVTTRAGKQWRFLDNDGGVLVSRDHMRAAAAEAGEWFVPWREWGDRGCGES